ncbi:MAG: hypothetical protein H5U40_17420, partial [Polyangiaceae bacterium]|nr:hypothetical protein [Polyangiaceae bacterium]
ASPKIRLELSVEPGSAETFVEVGSDGVERTVTESLQITYVATAGEMDRTFGFIDPGENTIIDTVGWEPPLADEVPPEGLLVRFYFVVRDGRGGVDYLERALCVERR